MRNGNNQRSFVFDRSLGRLGSLLCANTTKTCTVAGIVLNMFKDRFQPKASAAVSPAMAAMVGSSDAFLAASAVA